MTSERVKEYRRKWMAEWRKNNPEKEKAIKDAFRERNRDKINERQRLKYQDPEYRAKMIEREKQYKATGRRKELRIKDAVKRRAASEKWRQANLDRKREYMRQYKDKFWIEYERQQRELLNDKYVIKVIKKQFDYTIKTKDITPAQIEIKRNEILINRITKQIKLKENGELQNSRPS